MAPVLGPGDECPGGLVKPGVAVPYGHSSWAQAAEAIGISLLDVYGHNCYSRLPTSRYGSLSRLLSLSPSFSSHRGQYGPPDDMPKILGPAYTSVFEQQHPCRSSSCCWHVAGSQAAGALASSASSGGHAVGSHGSPSPPGAWSGLLPAAPLQSSAGHRAMNFSDLAPNSPGRPPLPSTFKLKGGKPSWGLPQKSSVPGNRRHRRSTGTAPASPPKARTNSCDGTAKGSAWSRGMAGATNKAGAAQRSTRSPGHHHQRTTGTASAGALIVAGGMRPNLASSGVVPRAGAIARSNQL